MRCACHLSCFIHESTYQIASRENNRPTMLGSKNITSKLVYRRSLSKYFFHRWYLQNLNKAAFDIDRLLLTLYARGQTYIVKRAIVFCDFSTWYRQGDDPSKPSWWTDAVNTGLKNAYQDTDQVVGRCSGRSGKSVEVLSKSIFFFCDMRRLVVYFRFCTVC